MTKEDGSPILDTPGGYGGIAGTAIHSTAVGQVSQFASALQDSGIGVIGAGGVKSGKTLRAMAVAGAWGAQVGTHYGEKGERVFSEILQEVA